MRYLTLLFVAAVAASTSSRAESIEEKFCEQVTTTTDTCCVSAPENCSYLSKEQKTKLQAFKSIKSNASYTEDYRKSWIEVNSIQHDMCKAAVFNCTKVCMDFQDRFIRCHKYGERILYFDKQKESPPIGAPRANDIRNVVPDQEGGTAAQEEL